jgi:hypothetical protein
MQPLEPFSAPNFSAKCPNNGHFFEYSSRLTILPAQMLLKGHIFAVQRNCFYMASFL